MLNVMMAAEEERRGRLGRHLEKLHETTANLHIRVLGSLIVWIVVGMVFYAGYAKMSWNNAFWYAVQAGNSIGFGNLSEPNDDKCHAFTIFLILAYSSVVGGGIGQYIPRLFESLVDRIGRPDESAVEDLTAYFGKINSPVHLVEYVWFCIKYYTGWYLDPDRALTSWCWCIWMFIGAVWWVNMYPNETFFAGIYLAITACSTAGLYGPYCKDPTTIGGPTCDLGMEPSIFVGMFVTIGVPRKSRARHLFLALQ